MTATTNAYFTGSSTQGAGRFTEGFVPPASRREREQQACHSPQEKRHTRLHTCSELAGRYDRTRKTSCAFIASKASPPPVRSIAPGSPRVSSGRPGGYVLSAPRTESFSRGKSFSQNFWKIAGRCRSPTARRAQTGSAPLPCRSRRRARPDSGPSCEERKTFKNLRRALGFAPETASSARPPKHPRQKSSSVSKTWLEAATYLQGEGGRQGCSLRPPPALGEGDTRGPPRPTTGAARGTPGQGAPLGEGPSRQRILLGRLGRQGPDGGVRRRRPRGRRVRGSRGGRRPRRRRRRRPAARRRRAGLQSRLLRDTHGHAQPPPPGGERGRGGAGPRRRGQGQPGGPAPPAGLRDNAPRAGGRAPPLRPRCSWAAGGGGGCRAPSPGAAAPSAVAAAGRCRRILLTGAAEHQTWRRGRLQHSGRAGARASPEPLGSARLGPFRTRSAWPALRAASGAGAEQLRKRSASLGVFRKEPRRSPGRSLLRVLSSPPPPLNLQLRGSPFLSKKTQKMDIFVLMWEKYKGYSKSNPDACSREQNI